MLHTYLAALALAATTLAASGCGGSSKTGSTTTATTSAAVATTAPPATTPTTTTPVPTGEPIKIQSGKPLSRSEWLAKGDAICTLTNLKLNSTVLRTAQDYKRVLPQAANYDRLEATNLSELVPPAALASDWKRIVTGVQRFGEYTSMLAEAALTNKLSAAPSITAAAKTVHEHLAAIAKRDGFKECSAV